MTHTINVYIYTCICMYIYISMCVCMCVCTCNEKKGQKKYIYIKYPVHFSHFKLPFDITYKNNENTIKNTRNNNNNQHTHSSSRILRTEQATTFIWNVLLVRNRKRNVSFERSKRNNFLLRIYISNKTNKRKARLKNENEREKEEEVEMGCYLAENLVIKTSVWMRKFPQHLYSVSKSIVNKSIRWKKKFVRLPPHKPKYNSDWFWKRKINLKTKKNSIN